MSIFGTGTKTTAKTFGANTPTNPSWVTNQTKDFSSAISGLLNSDPNRYVTGSSPLLDQAFGAASGLTPNNKMSTQATGFYKPPAQQGPGLLEGLTGQSAGGGPDWAAYFANNPDLQAEYLKRQDMFGSSDEYSEWHYNTFGRGEGRPLPTLPAPTPQRTTQPVAQPVQYQQPAPTPAPAPEPAGPSGFEIAQGLLTDMDRVGAPTVSAQQIGAQQIDPNAGLGLLADTSLLTGLQDYMNPYTNAVVDTTLSEFDDQAGRVRAAQDAQLARNNAFGGSRSAILEAQTEADLARTRAATDAGLRADAFNVGAGLSADDANRRTQQGQFSASLLDSGNRFNADSRFQADALNEQNRFAADVYNADSDFRSQATNLEADLQRAGLLGQLASAEGQDERANIGLLADLGQQQRDIESEARLAEINLLNQAIAMQQGLPLNLFNGSRQSGSQTNKSTTNPGLLDLAELAVSYYG